MQKINNIEIKNFKSIHDAKISDCKRVNIFIGYPNVGKSNILEALSLMAYSDKHCFVYLKDLCRYQRLIEIFSDGDKQKDAEIITDKYVYSLRFLDQTQLDFALIERTNYQERSDTVLSDSSHLLRNLRFNTDGAVNVLQVPNVNKPKIESPAVKKYDFKASGLNQNSNPTILKFPFGENLSEVIRHNKFLRKEVGQLFDDYNLQLIFDEKEDIKIQKKLDEYSAFQIPYVQIADTIQRLIFHKAAIQSNQNSVLLFEEPEAHMFPPYISKFTNDIIHDENNNQFFVTTHSPFVLNDLMDNLKTDELSIYIVSYKKNTGETIINRMNEEDVHEAYQFGYDFFMNIDKFISQEQHE